jgi:hypothetical protein
MDINFLAPLSNAWNRMQKSLFKPFDIKKWFVLGFTAFLANLLEWEGGSSADNEYGNVHNFSDFLDLPYEAWAWIERNPDWTTLIVLGILLLIGFFILLTWLSSRGKFMFLDNVIHDQALVKKPWRDYAAIAKSLFLWRLGYGIVAFIIVGSYLSYIYVELYDLYYSNISDSEMIFAAIRMGIFLVILAVIFSYISLFLTHFVVPLMYKNKSTVWIGWSRFMPLLQQNLIYFILYGLFILFLYIVVGIVIVIVGFLTCCVGFILLVIPYIGSVILLPVSVVFRALSVEFLEQFGEQYKLFPQTESGLEATRE